MLGRMLGVVVAAMSVALIGLTGAPANATPIGPDNCDTCNGGTYTLTSDGMNYGNNVTEIFRVTLTVTNTAGIIATLGAGTRIDSAAVKVSDTATGVTLFDAPTAGWSAELGGVNGNGCQMNASNGFSCAKLSGGASLTDGMFWTFDVSMAAGDFFGVEGKDASIKARFINTSGDKVGDLLSEELKIQQAQVPEPATLGVLSVGLIGLGFAARRRRKAA